MKILLPVDGSPCSARAAKYLVRHLVNVGRPPEVVLLAVDPPLLEELTRHVMPEDIARFHEKNAHAAFKPVRKLLDAGGIAYSEKLLVGEPGETIATFAKKNRCDLIVMGSHGRGALKALLLGSVVTKVLARGTIPVLVVR